MTTIKYQLYDEQMNCTHLKHPTDIPPMVGDILNFGQHQFENYFYCKVVKRQFEDATNTLIIKVEKL
jgi:hypothetical protein